ncbi:GNAT family N-acetyltransferase [Halosegnis sp.]|uniref:GNAT family N-acetyltransferase n=1 Tax=Halosegnis sp. TaxID=2864959 RepID=UPI0035D4899E
MSVSLEVRPAEESDAQAIEAVAAAAWEHDYPDLLAREHPGAAARDWYDPERIRRDAADPTHVLLLAEEDDCVVGFVHAFAPREDDDATAETGDILRVYVRPDARGRGVGRELVNAARQRLHERGYETVRAMALAANETATDFFAACGFERTDERGETTIDGDSYEEVVFIDRS